MSEREAVLFANSAFYHAFSTRDFDGMVRIWSKTQPLTCIHPGWDILYGREAVLEAWRGIMQRRPEGLHMTPRNERVIIQGDTAIVVCIEEVTAPRFLSATNIFVREGSTWCMVHHHAGPAVIDPASLEPADKPRGPIN